MKFLIFLFAASLAALEVSDAAYEAALRQLDQSKYEQALQSLSKVKELARLDAALYWQAYSLNKLGRTQEALTALGKLKQEYPKSRWLADAQVLEVDARQGSGKAAPEEQSNEELKMMALNAMLTADPDRAVAQITTLLKSNNSPKVKERALFVLSQHRSPKAQQLLNDMATGKSNPDLQSKAIRYIGMSGTPDSKKQLLNIYNSSHEGELKTEVIRALMIGGGGDHLLEIAKAEKDTHLRNEALRNAGILRKVPASMYYQNNDPEWKNQIVYCLFLANDGKGLVEIARKETDAAMKKRVVSRLSMMNQNKDAMDYMMEILK